MSIQARAFGVTRDGSAVNCFRLANRKGNYAEILDYGATIRAVVLDGTDVCLGYDTLEEYENWDACLGATVGRCANRIASGRFTLHGKEYTLAVNNGPNHLHGGRKGFDRYVWRHEVQGETLILHHTSPDGDEGYPGICEVEARFTFTEKDELILEFLGRSDADTVLNLTNHAYWNLEGHGAGSVGDHTMEIPAEEITENDVSSCPVGAYYAVEGTPFDLRSPKPLKDGWDSTDPQMQIGCGYDHNFVLLGAGMRHAGTLRGGGRSMTVRTTQPGLQLYTANFLTRRRGKGGVMYDRRCGVALEAQGFPNAVNLAPFPSVVLKAGEKYHQTILFAFQ